MVVTAFWIGERQTRRELLQSLQTWLGSGQSVNVMGEPGIGTAHLLRAVRRRETSSAVWVQLETADVLTPAHFWNYVAACLETRLADPVDAGPALPEERLAPEALERIDDAGQAFNAVMGLVADWVRTGNRLILLLNGLDRVLHHLESADISRLRSLQVRFAGRFAVGISSRDSLDVLVAQRYPNVDPQVSWWLNQFVFLRIGLLADDDVAELLDERERELRIELSAPQVGFDSDDRRFLEQEAGAHPVLLREAARYLFQSKQAYPQRPRQDLYDRVRMAFRMDRRVNALFERLWRRRSENEKQVLRDVQANVAVTLWPRDLEFLLSNGLLVARPTPGSQEAQVEAFSRAFAYWLDTQGEHQGATENVPPLYYYPSSSRLEIGAKRVELTSIENRLFGYLVSQRGQKLPPAQILESVWGAKDGSIAVVQRTIAKLRVKIEPIPRSPRYILSAYGQGYEVQNVQVMVNDLTPR